MVSTVLIDHPLKKQVMKLHYTVVKEAGAWKVLDVKVLGASMLEDLRSQAAELQSKGGFEAVLAAMRRELEKYKGVKLK